MKTALVLLVLALASVGCMKVPPGTSILVTDSPEPYCNARVNCYVAATRTIVMVPGQSIRVLAHEGCHAHQHWTILEETGDEPRRDMVEWLDTSEATAYAAVVEQAGPHEFGAHYVPLIEDFAEACARYMVDDDQWPLDPVRAAFFAERDFR